MIATCGHTIEAGISCSVDDGQIMSDGSAAITYGTYCDKCFFEEYFLEGSIENKEMDKFIMRVVNWTEKAR